MSRLIRFFVERHLLVNIIVLAVLATGLFVIRKTQREGFPATDLNLVAVRALWPGAAPDDVEKQLTIPIEQAVRSVDNVKRVLSTSSESLGFILIELYDDLGDEGLKEATTDVQDEIDSITGLPDDLLGPPRAIALNPARIPALEVFLSGPAEVVPGALLGLQDVLERVEGVSEVIAVGLGDPEVRVLLDPGRMMAHGLTSAEVIAAIRGQNLSDTGGKLEGPARRQLVVATSYEGAADVAQTVLRTTPTGAQLRLADVAQVEPGYADRGIKVLGDGRSGVSLVVRKRASADILRVVDRLRAEIDAYELPSGVTASIYRDSSDMARDRLRIVATNGIGGIFLVLIVLVFFLTRRIALWVAFGIPFAVLGTTAALPSFDITVNMVSMAAFVLVIGLIVDDAIVVAERIAFWRERGLSPRDAAVKGVSQMVKPVVAASATTVMAFSPMFFIGGLPGRFAWAIPLIVIIALSVSLFECFFLLPAHVSSDHGRGAGALDEKKAWMLALERFYQATLMRLLRYRGWVVAGFVGFFVATMAYAYLFVPIKLFPQDDANVLLVKVQMPLGTSLVETEAAVVSLEDQMRRLMGQDLEAINSRIGHRVPESTRNLGESENEAIAAVFLADDFEHNAVIWGRTLKERLRAPEGGRIWFEHARIGPPVGSPVTVYVSCDDDRRRRAAVRFVESALADMPAVTDIDRDDRPGLRQIELRPDHAELARLQVPIESVLTALRAAYLGLPVSQIRKSDDVVDIRVRFNSSSRQDLDVLLDSPVRSRTGALVPLRALVTPLDRPSLAHLHHRDGVRTTTVTAEIDPTSQETASSVAEVIRRDVLSRPELDDPRLRVSIGGEAETTAQTVGEMPWVALAALIGMILIITLLFGSSLQALFIVLAVPLGYAGVVWTFAAHGLTLSFFAFLGAVGLSGVVVNDSIVMVSTLTENLREAGRDKALDVGSTFLELVAEAATERLRPVLLTTLTTVVGVMPTAYGLGGRDALLSPMSLALGWGLVFATLITLILVPSLFVLRHDLSGGAKTQEPHAS